MDESLRFGIRTGSLQDSAYSFPGQQTYDDCSVMTDLSILRRFYGPSAANWSEDMIVKYAIDNGYALASPNPKENGVVLRSHLGSVLKAFGIETHVIHNATIFDLQNELAGGHAVKVTVDADELWGIEGGPMHNLKEIFGIRTPNHVVVCSELNTDDPKNIRVTLQDTGNGKIYSVPWSEFASAADDDNFTIICTDQSVQEFRALHPEWFGGNAAYLQEVHRRSIAQYALWQQHAEHYINNNHGTVSMSNQQPSHSEVQFRGVDTDSYVVRHDYYMGEHHGDNGHANWEHHNPDDDSFDWCNGHAHTTDFAWEEN